MRPGGTCYHTGPKVTPIPRWERKSAKAERGREREAEVKITYTWVSADQSAPPCSTWPTPSCLCWWSRGRDHMASRCRPLPVRSGSAPAQYLGSRGITTHTETHQLCVIRKKNICSLMCFYHTEQEEGKSFYKRDWGRGWRTGRRSDVVCQIGFSHLPIKDLTAWAPSTHTHSLTLQCLHVWKKYRILVFILCVCVEGGREWEKWK